MKMQYFKVLVIIMIIAVGGSSCNRSDSGAKNSAQNESGEPEMIQVRIESEDRTGASSEMEEVALESGNLTTLVPQGGWLMFDVPIKEPGRYKTEVGLSNGSENVITCWVEDHVDNKDDRQYNITGTMEFPVSDQKEQLIAVSKDGSPLNKGVHQMKLHVEGGQCPC